MFELYEVGTRCWAENKTGGWVGATVTSKTLLSPTECELELTTEESGDVPSEVRKLKITQDPAPEMLLRNPAKLEDTHDLVTLSHQNEPSVLHSIQLRYEKFQIYTYSGIVLIAINPFELQEELYTNQMVNQYNERQDREELDPHVFRIARDAFTCMRRDNKNQTIVVSGESGAGKTVSAKYIMRYFATVENPLKAEPIASSANTDDSGLSLVEREILATNPIMEAFGNAKTTRNDNSSRFGKYLEIRFNKMYDISGARIRTYLLERSRIVYHPESERNYHIFYQMLAGLDSEQLTTLGLDSGVSSFNYVQNGDPLVKGIDDQLEFTKTCEALTTVGVNSEKQFAIFSVLAGLLHLGNIELKPTSRSVLISTEDPALIKCGELLGLDTTQLAKWLSKKQIQMRSETIVSDIDAKAANVVRDSMAKFVYSALFDWLVSTINQKLYNGDGSDQFIGVLDIYGFEHFKHNSFEQFCINYANEKLQQEFNQHVFKLEQEEYASEEIDWTYIDFVDNQPCIELIENKMGILGLLDEESRLPAGTDDGFTQKLYNGLENNSNFKKPRLGQSSFIVSHYAHEVEYETAGFIEKNRDTVPDTIMNLLNESKNPLVNEVLKLQTDIRDKEDQNSKANEPAKDPVLQRRKLTQRPTLGNIFKTSLIELMSTISSTNVHYIRCIKPNETKTPWLFDAPMVLSQLRACGVLETIRISSKGFPGRWLYEDFVNRYIILVHSSLRDLEPKQLSEAILKKVCGEIETKMPYELGKTKVFLGSGLLAQIEVSRSKHQAEAAIILQKHIKGRAQRLQYQRMRQLMADLQNSSRAKLERLRFAKQLQERSTINLQAQIRAYMVSNSTRTTLKSVRALQNIVKLQINRRKAAEQRKIEFATSIQTLSRKYLAHKQFKSRLYVLCIVQSMTRRRAAVKQLEKMREEQQSVAHYAEEQYRMENKVVELQNLLSQKREEHRITQQELQDAQTGHKDLQKLMDSKAAQNIEEIKQLKFQISELVSKVDLASAEADKHVANYKQLKEDFDAKVKDLEDLRSQFEEKDDTIKNLNDQIAALEATNEELKDENKRAIANNIGSSAMVGYNRYAAGNRETKNDTDAKLAEREAIIADYLQEFDESPDFKAVNNMLETEFTNFTENLLDEFIEVFIKNLEVPIPPHNGTIPRVDVLFPGNLINLVLTEMWRFGLLRQSVDFMGKVFNTLQETVQKMSFDQLVYAAPFWLSNMQEVYSLFMLVESNIESNTSNQPLPSDDLMKYSTISAYAKSDVTDVIFNLYYVYMRECKKRIEKMIVPAVIEDQSIPGFKSDKSQSIMNKLFSSSSSHSATMDDLIMDLNKIYSALVAYYLEPSYIIQPIREIMELIGIKSFNDMLMRRNFLSWRRGVQINYNVTRLSEWCTGHKFHHEALSLESIIQATKLLQLKKNFEGDVSVIYDICWKLNPTQIHRILANYQGEDFEEPIDKKASDYIVQRMKDNTQGSSELVKPLRQIADAGPFEIAPSRLLDRIEPYVPTRVSAPKMRSLLMLTTRSVKMMDEANAKAQLEADRILAEQEIPAIEN